MDFRGKCVGCTIYAMPNIANVLKSEIARVARKEVRAETAALKKASRAQRAEIVALKQRARSLEDQVARLTKAKEKAVPSSGDAPAKPPRFSAKGLASQRRRLGLSAHDCGLLVGASGQSIYNWEDDKAHPRAANLVAIAALKSLSKREALTRLGELRGNNP